MPKPVVNEQTATSEELRQAELRYRKLFDLSPQPMWIFDQETLRILQVNAAAIAHYGYSEEEFLQLTIADIRPAEDVPKLREFVSGRTQDSPTDAGVWRHIKKDGTLIFVEVFGHGIDFGGRRARWAMVSDITGRVKAEQELGAIRERLEAALKGGRVGVFDFDLHTEEMTWDRLCKDIWGLSETEIPTMSVFKDGINPEDWPLVLAEIEAAKARPGEHSYHAEYRVRSRQDARERWVRAEADVIFSGPIATRMVGTVQDITERKEIEIALLEQRGLYKSITDNASLALFIMDARQQCVFMNPAAEQLTGFHLEELRGRPLHDYIHHKHPDGTPYPLAECPINQALPNNDRESGEEVFIHKDGHFYDVRFTASPVRDHQGQPTGTVIEVEDITERKRAERQISLLMQEVNHRSKNMLAVVQAIAAQTALHTDPEDFVNRFSERLQSLSACHDLLVRNSWQGIEMSELINSQFLHLGAASIRIRAEGPELWLSPSASQALGLALHELGTNAIKYGSLSGDGQVTITWEVRPDGQFGMRWQEAGGPVVLAPNKKGFGTRLIKQMTQMALEGRVVVHYEQAGLIWELSAPLQRVRQPEEQSIGLRSAHRGRARG